MNAPLLPVPLVVLTDRPQVRQPLRDVLRAAAHARATAVLVREKDLPRDERYQLARTARDLFACVIVAADVALAQETGADGVHLAATDPLPTDQRGLVVGRSCHDARSVARAAAEGCTYATVSPVFTSASKPGYGPALDCDGLAAVVATDTIPCIALGGIHPDNAQRCLRAGAAGVAVMGAVMRAEDPADTCRALLAAVAGGKATR
jgi:thiamine-phosphate pyrophosphorylase